MVESIALVHYIRFLFIFSSCLLFIDSTFSSKSFAEEQKRQLMAAQNYCIKIIAIAPIALLKK